MIDLEKISEELTQSLNLKHVPVGVTLYQGALPAHIPETTENLKSYCQALVLAGEGRSLLLKKEQMGCKLGTSVLGFETEMEAFLDDGVLEKYGVGLFATEEASAETLLKSTYLEKGKTRSVLIAPLAAFQEDPGVVVFTADSQQVMWLLYAVNYEKGAGWNCPSPAVPWGMCGHYGLASAHRPSQRDLFRSGLPGEIVHRSRASDDGHPGRVPPQGAQPYHGYGQAHSHVE